MVNYSNISSNSSLEEDVPLASFSFLFIPVFLLAIGGIPGTLFSIRFFSKKVGTSTTATNLILNALAVFDFLALLGAIPLAIASVQLFVRWNQEDYFAILNAITRLPRHYSNLMLLFISIERIVSVAWPHKMKDIFTKRVGMIYIIVIAIIAPPTLVPFAMEPKFVLLNKRTEDDVQYLMQLPQTFVDQKVYDVLYEIAVFVYFALPIGGVLVCNLTLVILLLRRFRSRHNSTGTLTPAQSRELRTTQLVMAVKAIFLLCVFPLVVILPITSIKGNFMPVKNMMLIISCSQLLENISYSMNAVVYYIGNKRFREEVSEMCRHFRKPKMTTVEPVTGRVPATNP
ncbi:adenosine receptor A3-like [Pecten maximus]|uniref:adenosine receptor A3-like n=1 Tax=Pecten maximus TaxID=6579 RepID=UPI00145813E6|nr:adenosine receptor A3-like [Pecten maximus]